MRLFAKSRDMDKYDSIPISICFTATGDGQDILRNVHIPATARKVVTFRVKIKYPQNKFWENYEFPPIEQGNAHDALHCLEILTRQNVLSKARQEEIAQVIALAEKATR